MANGYYVFQMFFTITISQPSSKIYTTMQTPYQFFFQPDITVGAIIPAARSNPLQPEEWCAFFDINGAVSNLDELKEKIFKGVRF